MQLRDGEKHIWSADKKQNKKYMLFPISSQLKGLHFVFNF